ncbi:MAG: 50S ribosomal protein L16 [Chloroflexi bacterium]|nr:50S ribosomal protein L16 [Chloroflexota bacterium]
MLQPKRVKYRKSHRGRRKGVATAATTLHYGEWGLKALDSAWVTARQVEAARRTITHHLRRGGQVWIRVFPDKAVTKKPAETRQGGGKGPVDHWVAVVLRGRMLFEVGGVTREIAREALKLAADKLPFSTRIVSREDFLVPTGAEEA